MCAPENACRLGLKNAGTPPTSVDQYDHFLERTISVGTPPRLDCEKRTPNGTLGVRVAMLAQCRCTRTGNEGCSAGLRQLLTVNRASLARRDSRMTLSCSNQLTDVARSGGFRPLRKRVVGAL